MNHQEEIRLRAPYPLARLYEAALLESEPRLRVIKLVELYEHALRYMALVGLVEVRFFILETGPVEEARADLDKPSLGHWLTLLRAVDAALSEAGRPLLTPLNTAYSDGPFVSASQVLAPLAEVELPKKVRLSYWLDLLVQFRNKKIGHGSLSEKEAREVVHPLKDSLSAWLAGLNQVQTRRLVYVRQVTWQDPDFAYDGLNLNAGTSIFRLELRGQKPLTPKRLYLEMQEENGTELLPLYPFFAFEAANNQVLVYHELSKKGIFLLRCSYDQVALNLESDPTWITGKQPTAPSAQVGQKAKSRPTEDRQIENVKEITAMRSWSDIITPHEDIRNRQFNEAIFAADLGDIVSNTAPDEYRNPYLFFKKTYATVGLQKLLGRVSQTLQTGKGAAVIQIQTPFGGGKTHALAAIYHFLKHGEQVKELLPPGLDLVTAKVTAIAGNHWNPVEGMQSGGVRRNTFWGEIAYQLGGQGGYQAFKANDEARISPGKDKLRSFLEAHQPFVLLFDEILEYINRALDEKKYDTHEKTGVSLGTQTFSFFQELSEAVATLPRGMLVVTLPSSFLEDYSQQTEESLTRLNKIFGRLESIETPVQGEEVYAVIRRRLFEVEGMKTGQMREVVHNYFQLYQQYHDDLPPKVRDATYRDKMELAYPFHPDVIDILYEKWSTYPTFQRTRGVLCMLANVVEDLYQREVPIDLILPGDINLEFPPNRQKFLEHIGQEYEGVIGSDIAGHEAKSKLLDDANKPWKHLAQRIASSIFFHSFSADDSPKGINLPYIKLAVMRSDTIPALATDVLGKLANSLWYLNSRGDAYYFSRIPNLNRMILDKKEQFNESYEDELKSVLTKEIGSKFRPYLWPENGEGIPDNRELKLVILRPEDQGKKIPEWIERRGNNFREYKNTLFFALADTAGFARLREDVKTTLALNDIHDDIKSGENPLLEGKRDEVERRIRDISRDYSYNVRRMYHVLRYGDANGGRTIDLGQPVTGKENLDAWFWRELISSDVGAILTQLHYRTVVNKFMLNNEQIAANVLLEQFYKNPELPALEGQVVLARAIQLGVKEGAFGLVEARQGEIEPRSLKYMPSTDIPLDAIAFDADTFILSKARCEAILARQRAEEEARKRTEEQEKTGQPLPMPQPSEPLTPKSPFPPSTSSAQSTAYKHIHLVVTDVPASKIADVNRGILMPLNRAVGDFKFTIEIDVTSAEGISQTELENQIKETIRQIGAKVESEKLE